MLAQLWHVDNFATYSLSGLKSEKKSKQKSLSVKTNQKETMSIAFTNRYLGTKPLDKYMLYNCL